MRSAGVIPSISAHVWSIASPGSFGNSASRAIRSSASFFQRSIRVAVFFVAGFPAVLPFGVAVGFRVSFVALMGCYFHLGMIKPAPNGVAPMRGRIDP